MSENKNDPDFSPSAEEQATMRAAFQRDRQLDRSVKRLGRGILDELRYVGESHMGYHIPQLGQALSKATISEIDRAVDHLALMPPELEEFAGQVLPNEVNKHTFKIVMKRMAEGLEDQHVPSNPWVELAAHEPIMAFALVLTKADIPKAMAVESALVVMSNAVLHAQQVEAQLQREDALGIEHGTQAHPGIEGGVAILDNLHQVPHVFGSDQQLRLPIVPPLMHLEHRAPSLIKLLVDQISKDRMADPDVRNLIESETASRIRNDRPDWNVIGQSSLADLRNFGAASWSSLSGYSDLINQTMHYDSSSAAAAATQLGRQTLGAVLEQYSSDFRLNKTLQKKLLGMGEMSALCLLICGDVEKAWELRKIMGQIGDALLANSARPTIGRSHSIDPDLTKSGVPLFWQTTAEHDAPLVTVTQWMAVLLSQKK